MDATRWVKLHDAPRLSWHIDVPEPDAAPDVLDHWTRCGLWADADAPTADDLPLGERSCERCLRLRARDAERAEAR